MNWFEKMNYGIKVQRILWIISFAGLFSAREILMTTFVMIVYIVSLTFANNMCFVSVPKKPKESNKNLTMENADKV